MTVSLWWQEPSLDTKVPSVGCAIDEEKRGVLNPSWPAVFCEKVTNVKNMIPSCASQGPTWSGSLSPPSLHSLLSPSNTGRQSASFLTPSYWALLHPLGCTSFFPWLGSFLSLGSQAECCLLPTSVTGLLIAASLLLLDG